MEKYSRANSPAKSYASETSSHKTLKPYGRESAMKASDLSANERLTSAIQNRMYIRASMNTDRYKADAGS
jgi:hypothetical protein